MTYQNATSPAEIQNKYFEFISQVSVDSAIFIMWCRENEDLFHDGCVNIDWNNEFVAAMTNCEIHTSYRCVISKKTYSM